MNFSDFQAVILPVLTDFRVILCVVFIVLYLHFVYFVVGYKKRPPVVKMKKKIIAAPAPAPAEGEQAAEQSAEDGEEA